MKEGDIVLAAFPYMESETKKFRPALVWKTTPVSASLIFISSQKLVAAYPTEVVLSKEESNLIGLSRTSKVDFGKRVTVHVVDVKKTLGHIARLPKKTLRRFALAADAAGLID
ncbi:type II toxin-antitoxin system PemK/MazF family toxin [Acidihalobacter ferrooxydans]|uniref:MazF family transcriptional regulator n=1 Tax=Acidihalobacter ferrooxydans TaxID=1765967 RepID=A0A1P8UFJ3_9GAMM|nr:type II toxin-antitoxin system PemK/MazF family toxin [Acidihalobacter ferrooxydans]APZ42605.1 hypothetical protein BW247_05415 [Acidihalobacter ferrooxydans]